jgi:hypothetical protein
MTDYGVVTGSEAQAQEIIIGADTVYIHTDIKKLNQKDEQGNDMNLYQYHEVQYSKDEYIKLLNSQVTETQEAIADIYETIATTSTSTTES